jgi:hypothetical protein
MDVFEVDELLGGMTPQMAQALLDIANEYGLAEAKAAAAKLGAQIIVEDE